MRRAPRSRMRLLLALATAAALAAVFASPALAIQQWRIDSLSNTTVEQGGQITYHVQAMNTGDADMDGSEIDLLATLDPGMRAVDANLHIPGFGNHACFAGDGTSPVLDATSVLCSTTTPVPDAPDSGGTGYMTFTLTVRVDPLATGTAVSSFQVSGGGADPASTVDPTEIVPAGTGDPPFGIDAFDGQVAADPAGDPMSQAGGHPYSASVSIDFNTTTNPQPLIGDLWPVEPVKDVFTDLPPGFVGDPTGADTCTTQQLSNGAGTQVLALCPSTSQVGTALIRFNGAPGFASPFGPVPVYNMVPPPNVPARFGFDVLGSVVVLDGTVRSGSDYGITIAARDVPQALAISGTTVTLWGDPSDPSHDSERACPNSDPPFLGGPSCRSGAPSHAFLRNPTSCTAPGVGLPTTARIDSWTHPGDFVRATFISHDPPGYPYPPSLQPPLQGPERGTTDCDRVPFTPTLVARPTSARAGRPSGFTFDLSLPQPSDPTTIGEADLRSAVVRLPLGVRVSPSSADGLGACSPADIALHTDSVPNCPLSSKVGTATITTPLLRDPLQGAVYLARQNDNPFGSLLAIYLVAEGPGVVVKLAGRVDADPISGQLTTTFDDNPQLPFSNLHLEFKGGARAPLVVPKQCGTYTTQAVMTGWNGKTIESDSSFDVSRDGNGAPCLPPQFAPDFRAGTADPVAGKQTTFNLQLTRGDDDDEFQALTVNMPSGLLGKIANATLCGDAQAAAGTCGDASKIGDVTTGAGAGTNPFYITNGRAYITGPYKGAPFGLSIVVPAVAGPFNLGDVNVRSALYVDKHDATLRVVSDPLPTILQGIPLDVRDIRVSVDKPDFIVNPTSCAAKTIGGAITATTGRTANVSSRFQVGECASLGFKPRMVLSVGGRGHTARFRTTPLSTTITMPQRGQANLRFVRVTLPDSINARLTVINDACTRAEFESDIRKCAHAIAGSAVASTPLLRAPLRGNVYFVKNGHPIPDLFVALRGQVDFDLIGQISIPHSRFLRTTFATAPDVPIRSFTLKLLGDPKNGSVGAAANLCSAASRRKKAQLDYIAQSGKVLQIQQALKIGGCKKPKPHRRHHGRR